MGHPSYPVLNPQAAKAAQAPEEADTAKKPAAQFANLMEAKRDPGREDLTERRRSFAEQGTPKGGLGGWWNGLMKGTK